MNEYEYEDEDEGSQNVSASVYLSVLESCLNTVIQGKLLSLACLLRGNPLR